MYLLRRLEATHRTALSVRYVLPQVQAPWPSCVVQAMVMPPPSGLSATWLLALHQAAHHTELVPSWAYKGSRNAAQVPEADEVFAAYDLAHASIEQFMHNTHNEWFQTIDPNISRELSATLMVADKAQGGWPGLRGVMVCSLAQHPGCDRYGEQLIFLFFPEPHS